MKSCMDQYGMQCHWPHLWSLLSFCNNSRNPRAAPEQQSVWSLYTGICRGTMCVCDLVLLRWLVPLISKSHMFTSHKSWSIKVLYQFLWILSMVYVQQPSPDCMLIPRMWQLKCTCFGGRDVMPFTRVVKTGEDQTASLWYTSVLYTERVSSLPQQSHDPPRCDMYTSIPTW